MDLKFTKMQGAGNDFIFMTDAAGTAAAGEAGLNRLARELCSRHYGIGADGLILLKPEQPAGGVIGMRIINSDGSEAAMCGNAVRCAAVYLREKGDVPSGPVRLSTPGGLKEAEITAGPGGRPAVRVDMGPVCWSPGEIPVSLSGREFPPGGEEKILDREIEVHGRIFRVTCLSMGNPHCVVFTDDLSDRFIREWGPRFETHPLFPDRINTEFVRVLSPGEVRVRVWERGCGETLACGTGAAAVCAAGSETRRTGRRILCRMAGGDLLLERTSGGRILKTGPAEIVYEGVWRSR